MHPSWGPVTLGMQRGIESSLRRRKNLSNFLLISTVIERNVRGNSRVGFAGGRRSLGFRSVVSFSLLP
jgi:hypothetical protein